MQFWGENFMKRQIYTIGKATRKILSLLQALVIVIGGFVAMLPATAFAADTTISVPGDWPGGGVITVADGETLTILTAAGSPTNPTEIQVSGNATVIGSGDAITNLYITSAASVTLTIENLNISAPSGNSMTTAKPAIDLASGSTLIVDGANTLNRDAKVAGIHVPDPNTLTITGTGSLLLPTTAFAAGGLTGPTTINAQVGVNIPFMGSTYIFYAGTSPWYPITISGTLPDGLIATDGWENGQEYVINGTAQPGTVGTWPITASNADGGTINCNIIVSEGPQTIVQPDIVKTVNNTPFQLTPYSTNGNGDTITGTDTPTYTYGVSSNTAVATVNASGNVTIVGAGTTTFTINSDANDSYQAAAQKTVTLTVKNVGDCGLIFDASSNPTTGGKFWVDVNDNQAIDPGTDFEYTEQPGAWGWDGSASMLTLTDFTWETPASHALTILNSDLTIDLNGTNTFATTSSANITYGIWARTSLTVIGGGTLNATAINTSNFTYAIAEDASLIVNSGTVNAKGNAGGVSYGIATQNLTVNGGEVDAAALSDSANSIGIYNPNSLTINGGTVTAVGMGRAFFSAPTSLPSSYVYWTNTTTFDPGGAGTTVPGGTPYSYSASDQYVKILTVKETGTVDKSTPAVILSATGGTYTDNSITLTTTVGAGVQGQAYKPAPTGTVTFMEGDTTLAVKTLNRNGTATFTIASLIDEGSYTFAAEYSGDDNYEDAVSDPCTVVVTAFLSVSSPSLHFGAQGGTQQILLACNSVWSLDNSASWLTIAVSDFKADSPNILLNVTATANPDATQRTALITLSLPGVMIKAVSVTQDAGVNPATGMVATGAPSVIVYSQGGNAVVKSDTPIQSVAVYDVSGILLKQVKGENNLITISGLPKQQVLIVRVTSGRSIKNYKLKIKN